MYSNSDTDTIVQLITISYELLDLMFQISIMLSKL